MPNYILLLRSFLVRSPGAKLEPAVLCFQILFLLSSRRLGRAGGNALPEFFRVQAKLIEGAHLASQVTVAFQRLLSGYRITKVLFDSYPVQCP